MDGVLSTEEFKNEELVSLAHEHEVKISSFMVSFFMISILDA